MEQYIDGYLLSVPKANIEAYRKLAEQAGSIWLEYGALEFRECVFDFKRMCWGGFSTLVSKSARA